MREQTRFGAVGAALLLLGAAGCVGEIDQEVPDNEPDPGDGDGDGGVEEEEILTPVSGLVIDFDGGAPMALADVASEELVWTATTDDTGAFQTDPILEGTIFSFSATISDPEQTYRTTVNPMLVSDALLTDTQVYIMKSNEGQRQAQATGEAFVIEDAIVVVELLKGDGTPREGIPLNDIELIDQNGAEVGAGPYVLGEGNLADPNLDVTTAIDGKAQVIFFNVKAGTHELTALYPQNDGGEPQPKTAMIEAVDDGAILLRLNDPALK